MHTTIAMLSPEQMQEVAEPPIAVDVGVVLLVCLCFVRFRLYRLN